MRALAHPARIAIMEHLTATGADATATECAEVVGLTPSATSYHLRALAKAGMIEDAPSRGDGRERVWRTRYRGYSIVAGHDADPEARAAEEAVVSVFLARGDERVRRWAAIGHEATPEWYEAAFMSETVLIMTAEELTQLTGQVTSMLEPYRRAERKEAPEGARKVSFQLRAVPVD